MAELKVQYVVVIAKSGKYTVRKGVKQPTDEQIGVFDSPKDARSYARACEGAYYNAQFRMAVGFQTLHPATQMALDRALTKRPATTQKRRDKYLTRIKLLESWNRGQCIEMAPEFILGGTV